MTEDLMTQKNGTRKVHRVGTITAGLMLIVFGVLFLMHLFLDNITYAMIFHLWPIILICLGVEILVSQIQKQRTLIYDKGAVFIMVMMLCFSMAMAFLSAVFESPWFYCI